MTTHFLSVAISCQLCILNHSSIHIFELCKYVCCVKRFLQLNAQSHNIYVVLENSIHQECSFTNLLLGESWLQLDIADHYLMIIIRLAEGHSFAVLLTIQGKTIVKPFEK